MISMEVLVSTMDRLDSSFLKNMNLESNVIVINQNMDKKIDGYKNIRKNIKMYSYKEKGLSKSRNKAILKSNADICVIADDDVSYLKNYEEIIKKQYELNPTADVIAFIVERIGTGKKKAFRKKASIQNYISSMKISSVEITFKRKSIIENGITFNEKLGAGADFIMGEENVFLYDCLKKGLKVHYVPVKIGVVSTDESSWFKGYNENFFNSLGAAYYCMSKCFYPILIIQFALRKYKMYKDEYSMFQAIINMVRGVKKYKGI